MESMRTMWRFKTAQFTVRARIVDDYSVDTSFDETGETVERLERGDWSAFGTIVEVIKNDRVIGESSLWGNIYADPREFFVSHWDSEADYRNTLDMESKNSAVCHYFPELVREAIADARKTLALK